MLHRNQSVAVVAVLLMTLPLAATGLAYLHEWFEIDACLDSGGSFDYASGMCRHEVIPPHTSKFIPFAERNRALVVTASTAWFIGAALLLLVESKRRAGTPGPSRPG